MENTFRTDVLQDIAWEKENLNKQIELLEPLKRTLHRSAGMKMLSASGYFFFQLLCWAGIIGLLAWLIFMFRVAPFYELANMMYTAEQSGQYRSHEFTNIEWAIRLMVIVLIVLLFIIDRQLAKLRKKNNLASVAGKTIADMQGKLEERMNTLESFEHKYSYLLRGDITIELDQFNNPLPPPERPDPPQGDEYLD